MRDRERSLTAPHAVPRRCPAYRGRPAVTEPEKPRSTPFFAPASALFLLLAACSAPSQTDPAGESPAFVQERCADSWPADTCGDDGCDADPVGSRWEATFTRAFSQASGQTEDAVAQHVRIRNLVPAPSLTAITAVDHQVDVDRIRHVEVWADGPAAAAAVAGAPPTTT